MPDPVAAQPTPRTQSVPGNADRNEALWERAKEFEAQFVSEMLEIAKGDAGQGGMFSGGYAESTMRSLLTREQAENVVENGGFGVAEQVYREIAGEARNG